MGIAIEVPIDLFPRDKTDYLVWATSHKGLRQIDHVGRSLRTQNPRFKLINKLHPREHKQALLREHNNPTLKRDLLLRANFASYFAFRAWDFVPDVMCFSTRFPAGFPNGRLLTDDVAAILAQHGDTLLYELSYQDERSTWPRQTKNDTNNGEFLSQLPYLTEPHKNPRPEERLSLTNNSIAKLIGIGILLLGALFLLCWIVVLIDRWRRYDRKAL